MEEIKYSDEMYVTYIHYSASKDLGMHIRNAVYQPTDVDLNKEQLGKFIKDLQVKYDDMDDLNHPIDTGTV